MNNKVTKHIICLALTLTMCLTGNLSVYAEETGSTTFEGDITLNTANGGIGEVESPVGANVTANFKVVVPANIDLSNDSGYCSYNGHNVVGIGGELPVNRAVSLYPKSDVVVLTSGSGEASKSVSVPVSQDQIVWGKSELADGKVHYTNLSISGALDPGAWSGKVTFQVKINDITLCESNGHDYNNKHVCARCGALEGGTFSLQKEFRKSWEDLKTAGIVEEVTGDDGAITATIDDSLLDSTNILVVPGTVSYVGCKNASQSTGAISELVLLNGVKGITGAGFANRSGLKKVTIPGSMKKVADSAFKQCGNLSSVILNDGVETIGAYAFGQPYLLNSITIPRSVTRIENNAFSDCVSQATTPFQATWVQNITFLGTKAEWKAMKNESNTSVDFTVHDGSTRFFTVKCTDGTLKYNSGGLAEET